MMGLLLGFLLTLAVCLVISAAWDWLNTHKGSARKAEAAIITQAHKAETYGAAVFYHLEPALKKEEAVISDAFQAKLSQLGAAISNWKTRAEAAEKTLSDRQAEIDAANARQGELDAANAHVADLTTQLATLQAQLDQAKSDAADELSAVASLADQAAAG